MVSIIIPVFNRASLIKETLKSIQIQTYENWECIVVDDGSDDNTESVIAQISANDSRFRLLKRPETKLKGPNSCRNYGFENAKGQFIYFFDSDDILKPIALESFINSFQNTTDGVLARVERIEKRSGKRVDVNTIYSDNLIEDYFNYKVCYFVCGIMWKKSFLDKQNELFDESLGNHDEWDFNLRMIYANPNMVRIHDILVTYFQYDDSFKKEIQKGNAVQLRSAFQARLKHLALLEKRDIHNKVKYSKHIANYYKKTVRNKMVANQENWFTYYQKANLFYFRSNSYFAILKLSTAILVYKFFKRGYSLFD